MQISADNIGAAVVNFVYILVTPIPLNRPLNILPERNLDLSLNVNDSLRVSIKTLRESLLLFVIN